MRSRPTQLPSNGTDVHYRRREPRGTPRGACAGAGYYASTRRSAEGVCPVSLRTARQR
jgi:hypothetical protein